MAQAQILIADDSPTIREMLKFALESEGYEVITASDGVDAIEQTYYYDPDIILLDLMMPRMNGYQVCRILKNDKETSDIPVIMLTAQDQPKDKFWGLQTGAEDYIIKDFESDEIFESIDRVLKKRKTRKKRERGSLSKISLDSIVSRINDLLDEKLFQSTLLNEINYIAQTRDSCEEVTKELLYLVNRVVSYKIGAMLLRREDESMSLSVYLNSPIDEDTINELINRMVDSASMETGFMINRDTLRITTFGEKKLTDGSRSDPINSFLAFPLRSHKRVIGILFLASTESNAFSDTAGLLNLIANESAVVVDNTMLNDEIKRLAITDGLTKCFNHRHFQDILANEFMRAKRYKLHFSLVIGDIDHFKQVNDTYGHQVGDIVLKGVANLLKKSVRDIDFVARYGGEEFAVIMPETPNKGAVDTTERLRRGVENFIFSGLPQGKRITISLGIGSYPDLQVKDQFELIDRVDKALYRAKEEGRNRICKAV